MSDHTTKLLNACVEYRAMVDRLETENAALREELEYAIKAGAKREADLLVMLGKEAQP